MTTEEIRAMRGLPISEYVLRGDEMLSCLDFFASFAPIPWEPPVTFNRDGLQAILLIRSDDGFDVKYDYAGIG